MQNSKTERMNELLNKQKEVRKEMKRLAEEERIRREKERKNELERRMKPIEEVFLNLSEKAVECAIIVKGIKFLAELFLKDNYDAITFLLERADEADLQKIEKYEDITVKKELTTILRTEYIEGDGAAFDRFTMDMDEYSSTHPFIGFECDGRYVLIKWKTNA